MPLIARRETPSRLVPGYGPQDAKIVVVAEAPGTQEVRIGRPLVGPSGTIYEQCLHWAGLIRAEIYATNVIKIQPNSRNDISGYFKEGRKQNKQWGTFTDKAIPYLRELERELKDIPANIIVTMGNPALVALNGLVHRNQVGDIIACEGPTSIMATRGYVRESTLFPGRKTLPTIHVAATDNRSGQHQLRYVIASDFAKAKRHSEYPGVPTYPHAIYIPNSFEEALAYLRHFEKSPEFAVDIETIQHEVSCISFCDDLESEVTLPGGETKKGWSVSVPFYGCWTEAEETELWRAVARTLGNPQSTKVLQNAMFDIGFLYERNGIIVRGPIHDTMIAHHMLYPDLRKGLGFIASFQLDYPEWKSMVNFKGLKKDD